MAALDEEVNFQKINGQEYSITECIEKTKEKDSTYAISCGNREVTFLSEELERVRVRVSEELERKLRQLSDKGDARLHLVQANDDGFESPPKAAENGYLQYEFDLTKIVYCLKDSSNGTDSESEVQWKEIDDEKFKGDSDDQVTAYEKNCMFGDIETDGISSDDQQEEIHDLLEKIATRDPPTPQNDQRCYTGGDCSVSSRGQSPFIPIFDDEENGLVPIERDNAKEIIEEVFGSNKKTVPQSGVDFRNHYSHKDKVTYSGLREKWKRATHGLNQKVGDTSAELFESYVYKNSRSHKIPKANEGGGILHKWSLTDLDASHIFSTVAPECSKAVADLKNYGAYGSGKAKTMEIVVSKEQHMEDETNDAWAKPQQLAKKKEPNVQEKECREFYMDFLLGRQLECLNDTGIDVQEVYRKLKDLDEHIREWLDWYGY